MRNSRDFPTRIGHRNLTDIQFPGYAFRMGKGAVTWSSKKQAIMALSKHVKQNILLKLTRLKSLFGSRTFLGEANYPILGTNYPPL